jgi:hypothetical protein
VRIYSSDGREIEHGSLSDVTHGMKRFHRVVSLTLQVLASLSVVVDLYRIGGLYPRITLASTLMVFCG